MYLLSLLVNNRAWGGAILRAGIFCQTRPLGRCRAIVCDEYADGNGIGSGRHRQWVAKRPRNTIRSIVHADAARNAKNKSLISHRFYTQAHTSHLPTYVVRSTWTRNTLSYKMYTYFLTELEVLAIVYIGILYWTVRGV